MSHPAWARQSAVVSHPAHATAATTEVSNINNFLADNWKDNMRSALPKHGRKMPGKL